MHKQTEVQFILM